MERLTMTSDKGGVAFTFDLEINCKPSEMLKILKLAQKLKEYEDAEEKGLLIRLPVPIGCSVYILDYTFECKLDYKCDDLCEFKCNDDIFCEHEYKKYRIREAKFKYEMLEYIGKTAFLTREEAEAALAEMEG